MAIDAHNHFWQYHPVKHSWINEDMAVLKKDFLPENLSPLIQKNKIDGCIAVQADESETENNFLLQLAKENDFIKGIVGWIDMLADDAEERIQYYSRFKIMKGFRYVLQDKKDRALMLHPVFKKNIALLHKYGFTYDLLIFKDQLGFVNQLVQQFPQQKFVLNHLAKPEIKTKKIQDWNEAIIAIAKNENIYCKLSGMVTEADWNKNTYQDFVPYMEIILENFGSKRIMYGSDWPVCLLAADYENVFNIVEQFIGSLSNSEQEDILGNNAINFYNL